MKTTLVAKQDHPGESERVLNPLLLNADELLAYARQLNPSRECLTVAVLRSFPGCAHYSDLEAEAILQAIDQLIAILFEVTKVQKGCTPVKPLSIPPGGDPTPGAIPIFNHPKHKAA